MYIYLIKIVNKLCYLPWELIQCACMRMIEQMSVWVLENVCMSDWGDRVEKLVQHTQWLAGELIKQTGIEEMIQHTGIEEIIQHTGMSWYNIHVLEWMRVRHCMYENEWALYTSYMNEWGLGTLCVWEWIRSWDTAHIWEWIAHIWEWMRIKHCMRIPHCMRIRNTVCENE